MDIQETKSTIEHEASANLSAGPAGSDKPLQGKEVTGSTLTQLDELFETSKALTQVLGDAEDRTVLINPPEDISELITSVEESDLGFAKQDGCPGKDRVTSATSESSEGVQ